MKHAVRGRRQWRALALLPLGTGAALIIYVLTRVSLGLALIVTVALAGAIGIFSWRHLAHDVRVEVSRRIRAGAIAGVPALVAYDGCRWLFVTVFRYTFWPFDIFSIFGHAIAGTGVSPELANIIGMLYHFSNAILFATAYAILFAPRGWWVGVLWALGLEGLMLAIYPGWLHPKAFSEFLSVSMLGHVAYGLVLGSVSRWIHGRFPSAKVTRTGTP